MGLFSRFLETYENELNLLCEMPRYGENIAFDQNDFNYIKAFVKTAEEETKKIGIELTDLDIIDVIQQALLYRFSKAVLGKEGDDPRDIPFKVPGSNMNTLVRNSKEAKAEFADKEGKANNYKRARNKKLFLVAKNVPINAKQLRQKILDAGFDPDRMISVKKGGWTDQQAQTRAYVIFKYLYRGEGEVPTYTPDARMKIGEDEKETKSKRKEEEKKGREEFKVKGGRDAEIRIDDDDERYLAQVRERLRNYTRSDKKLQSFIDNNMEAIINQAFAQRYGTCFIRKKGDGFAPRLGYETDDGTVFIRLVTGDKLELKNITIKATALAKRFQDAKNMGIDFFEKPLYRCGFHGDTDSRNPKRDKRPDASSLTTVQRWRKQGYYRPMSGKAGLEFVPDAVNLKRIEDKHGGEENWQKIVLDDVHAAWKIAVSHIFKYMKKGHQRDYMSGLNSCKEGVIDAVFTQVYMGLSGNKENYEDREWRVKRATSMIKDEIERTCDPLINQVSASAPITHIASDHLSLADIAPARTEPTSYEDEDEPEPLPQPQVPPPLPNKPEEDDPDDYEGYGRRLFRKPRPK